MLLLLPCYPSPSYRSAMASTIEGGEEQRCCKTYIDNEFHVNLASALTQLKKKKHLCDVAVVCENDRFSAHKIVLAAASEYFFAMFAGGLAESRPSSNEIELKELESEAVESLITYAYTGLLEINNGNVQSLLEASDLLQFNKVKEYCSDFIASQIDESNCLDVYQLADQYSCQLLLSKVLSFFRNNFKDIASSKTFLKLRFDSIQMLLQNEDLCIQEEGDVLLACLKWLNYNYPQRKHHRTELLKFVQFPFITPKNLEHIYENFDNKQSILPFRQKISLLKPLISNKYCNTQAKMRKSYEQWLYVFGGERSFLNEINDVECFHHSKETWELSKPLKRPRSCFAAVAIDQKLYVIGGMRRSVKLRSAKCFDADTGKWTTLPPPLKCRGDVKAAVADKMLYVAGGSGERESACRYLERYDPEAKVWTKLEKMNNRRRRFNLVSLNGYLYALGGFDDKYGDLNSVEHYDPNENKWIQDASMITPRNDFGAVALSGFIYAVGGVNGARGSIDLVERFNPELNAWSPRASMHNCRGGISTAVFFGRIVAISGINIYMSLIETAEYYDEVEDKWQPFPSVKIARSGSVAICLPFRMPNSETSAEDRLD